MRLHLGYLGEVFKEHLEKTHIVAEHYSIARPATFDDKDTDDLDRTAIHNGAHSRVLAQYNMKLLK